MLTRDLFAVADLLVIRFILSFVRSFRVELRAAVTQYGAAIWRVVMSP